jgi:hypothetical protein
MGRPPALLVLAAGIVLALACAPPAVASTSPATVVNCSDFSTQAAAQAYFISRGGPALDPEGLDRDRDGIACEALPCPCSHPPPPSLDTDADGLPNASDSCPTVPAATPNGCPIPDVDADGVPNESDLCPTVPASTPDGCPARDTDIDGVIDANDRCPTVPAATPDGCPPPPRPHVYVGTFSRSYFGLPGSHKPRELHPYSAFADNLWLYGLRWRRWGEARAYARGKGAENCLASCAEGRFIRRRGARATLFRLRDGVCDGEPARFYTRARLRFPHGFAHSVTVMLLPRCEP